MNIKTAASSIAAVAAVVGAAAKTIHHRKMSEPITTTKDTTVLKDEWIAFEAADRTISARLLSGYYDEETDAKIREDFAVIFNTLKQ